MRISDWSSDVASTSDSILARCSSVAADPARRSALATSRCWAFMPMRLFSNSNCSMSLATASSSRSASLTAPERPPPPPLRSEEHTSELQSLMRTSYAVFCFKKKKTQKTQFSHLPHQFKTTQAIYENNMNDTKICTYIHSYMTT